MILNRFQVAVNSSSFVPVTVPIFCQEVIIYNDVTGGNDIYTRTISTDSTTEHRLPAGTNDPRFRLIFGGGFSQNEVPLYLKSVTGSFNVNVECRG